MSSVPADNSRPFLPDIELLEQVTRQSYPDWRVHRDGDSFSTRRQESVAG